MLPKAIDCLANLLEQRGLYRSAEWHTYTIALFSWLLIAMTFVLERTQKKVKNLKLPKEEVRVFVHLNLIKTQVKEG